MYRLTITALSWKDLVTCGSRVPILLADPFEPERADKVGQSDERTAQAQGSPGVGTGRFFCNSFVELGSNIERVH